MVFPETFSLLKKNKDQAGKREDPKSGPGETIVKGERYFLDFRLYCTLQQ